MRLKGFNGKAFGVFDALSSFNEYEQLDMLTTKGAADKAETKWHYSKTTGRLESKSIAEIPVFSQELHPDGRIKSYTIDGLSKTFNYTDAPQLFPAGIAYESAANTPDVTVSGHNTFGQPSKIETAGICTHNFSYNIDAQVIDDNLTSSIIEKRNNSYHYNNLLRSQMDSGDDTVSYTYDDAKRLSSISSGNITTQYTYVPKSINLIDTITVKKDDDIVLIKDFSYEENSNRIVSVDNTIIGGPDLDFDYQYHDNTNKIKTFSMSDGEEYRFTYDERGQLENASKYIGAVKEFEYGFKSDSITNILQGGRVLFGSSPEYTYTPDIFNTVVMRRVGNTIQVSGRADKAASIIINDEKLERDENMNHFSVSSMQIMRIPQSMCQ